MILVPQEMRLKCINVSSKREKNNKQKLNPDTLFILVLEPQSGPVLSHDEWVPLAHVMIVCLLALRVG